MAGILITGAGGQVGRELARIAGAMGLTFDAVTHERLDISRKAAIDRVIADAAVGLIINAAAYTGVDEAETDQARARAVNRDGPGYLAEACRKKGVPLIHFSTDYVFDGAKQEPYSEADPVAPLGIYGQSKAAGEAAVRDNLAEHIIIRSSWIHSPYRGNFVTTMLRLGRAQDELGIIDDQIGAPTAAADVAQASLDVAALLADKSAWGTYHFSASGSTSWYGFAEEIFRTGESRPRLLPIAAAAYPLPAVRPANSLLDCRKITTTFGIRQRPWREGLAETMARIPAPEAAARAIGGGV